MKNFIFSLLLLGALTAFLYTGLLMLAPAMMTYTNRHKLNPIVRLVLNGRTFCSGTVTSPITIFTAAHCVMQPSDSGYFIGPARIEIRAEDNKPIDVWATVIYADPRLDQAALRGDFRLFDIKPYLSKIEDITSALDTNKQMISCGYPLLGPLYCSDMVYQGRYMFGGKFDGLLLPGMSGGPLMLPNGTQIGINTAVNEDFSVISIIYNIDELIKPISD